AERGEQGVGPLDADHLGDELGREGLDVGPVGDVGVGHDRGGVRVDEHDLEARRAQRLARLRARVVELGRLPDDDGTGADDQDLVYVLTPRHLYPAECITAAAGLRWVAAGTDSRLEEVGTAPATRRASGRQDAACGHARRAYPPGHGRGVPGRVAGRGPGGGS